MQAISGDLAALLVSELQAGPSGFRCRVEVDRARTVPDATGEPDYGVVGGRGGVTSIAYELTGVEATPAFGVGADVPTGWTSATLGPATGIDPSRTLIVFGGMLVNNGLGMTPTSGWTEDVDMATGEGNRGFFVQSRILGALGSTTLAPVVTRGSSSDNWAGILAGFYAAPGRVAAIRQRGVPHTSGVNGNVSVSLPLPPLEGSVLVVFTGCSGFFGSGFFGGTGLYTGFTDVGPGLTYAMLDFGEPVAIVGQYRAVPGDGSPILAVAHQPTRLDIEQSLAISAGQLSAEFANEELPLGWGPSSVFPTNSRIRAFQWYGDAANEVRTFTGVVDRVADSRDPLTTAIACRDMMALLIDTTFSATAPQGAGETGAVRTEANGVYLSREVSYIVGDILDRWGWPAADRAITPTSYTLAEYTLMDGESGAGAIIGQDRLGGLVGYDAWADELGVFHFAPSVASRSLTGADAPAYTFRTGVDILSLSDSTDQYDLRTRVKVRGPLTTETLTDTWRELWRTSKISRPVGIWFDAADPGNIRVIDAGTKRLYKLRQSDRVVLSSVYLGSVISYPLGISGDPSDATIYWVLNAPWYYTGSTSGNSVKKVRKSDNVVLATYTLPNGRWSAIKASGAWLYLPNLDTDRVYRRSKTDATAHDDFSHTVASVSQLNPSGIMVDGTTLYTFWANGGTTARFLVSAESAPGTVTKTVATAGTNLHGGEMDTVTHTECWGDSDTLHLTAKFTLVDVTATTAEVFAEAVDTALEDELGVLAQVEPRIHDSHPGDASHPWVARRDTVTLDAVISLAQATETANRSLDVLARRSRVLDAGILGNPALQKTDIVRVEDPVTGIAEDWLIDTHRTSMSAGGTWVGTLALIPADSPADVVADDGSAS